ncbi:hypothetical protein [Nocardia abscessus]|uniref:hypothetical protein n=1 Tax=Nocardia abscessus TaxID=120957 RepID=UPI0024590BDD|nr:hypothetical protein [Nocardia abscessus]
MSDLDPLTGNIEQLETSLTQSSAASIAGDAATVEVGPDGSLRAIRLTDLGRRLDPDTLAESIVRLHAAALAESRTAVAAAIARIENDPRLRAVHTRTVDALDRPLPHDASPSALSWPQPQPSTSAPIPPPAPRRQPTAEEEEEMDRYYQRRSWLE